MNRFFKRQNVAENKVNRFIFSACMIVFLTLLSGCGTISSDPVIDTAKIGILPAEENAFGDKELERLFSNYRKDINNASGDVLKMADISVTLDGRLAAWEKNNIEKYSNDTKRVKAIREYLRADCLKYKQIKELSYLIEKIKNTSNFSEYEKASNELIDRCRWQKDYSIWTTEEQMRFYNKYRDMEEKLSSEKVIYNEIVSNLRKQLTIAQKSFVDKSAEEDYTSARQVYKRENSKWFNWGWIGYPRDNKEIIISSAAVCDRIIKTDKVAYSLRSDASTLRGNLVERLNASTMKKYESKPALPSYEKIKAYPGDKNTEKELIAMANKEWLDKRDGKLKTYNAELTISMKGNLK